jgi:pSer/pThr/pTyr-binding forkhead associated (FHA) protein
VLTIGRDRTCDLVLSDRTVSRLHAVLRRFGDEWFVEDLTSTNGTRVNGIRIRAATIVRAGDRLGLGGTAFRVDRPSP